MVAPTNTRPPAVAMDPPLVVGVPVLGTPSLSSSAKDPSGTRQAISPVLMFTATISPQGGCWQGHCLVPSQKYSPMLVGGSSGPTRDHPPPCFSTSLLKFDKLLVSTNT